jgi:hypothetical protein
VREETHARRMATENKSVDEGETCIPLPSEKLALGRKSSRVVAHSAHRLARTTVDTLRALRGSSYRQARSAASEASQLRLDGRSRQSRDFECGDARGILSIDVRVQPVMLPDELERLGVDLLSTGPDASVELRRPETLPAKGTRIEAQRPHKVTLNADRVVPVEQILETPDNVDICAWRIAEQIGFQMRCEQVAALPVEVVGKECVQLGWVFAVCTELQVYVSQFPTMLTERKPGQRPISGLAEGASCHSSLSLKKVVVVERHDTLDRVAQHCEQVKRTIEHRDQVVSAVPGYAVQRRAAVLGHRDVPRSNRISAASVPGCILPAVKVRANDIAQGSSSGLRDVMKDQKWLHYRGPRRERAHDSIMPLLFRSARGIRGCISAATSEREQAPAAPGTQAHGRPFDLGPGATAALAWSSGSSRRQ